MSEAFIHVGNRLFAIDGSRAKAVVLGVQLTGVDDGEFASSLEELERLATTLGLELVGRVTQKRYYLAPGTVVGQGKLKELASWTGGEGTVPVYQKPGSKQDADDAFAPEDPEPESDETGAAPTAHATVVLVDHELSPTQQRNLEKATGADVLDRASIILEIFHRHAKTREAKLQVEIARLGYLAPRLRESAGGEDRVRGGVGGKGAGESSLELDRRKIRDRIAELRRELAAIAGNAATRRQRRSALPTVALVGYTNAGKSSLMRALTGSEVYVADKLFATLDTTVRALVPPAQPPVLVTDTVGFIKKLPHDLVASFRSTLDEANEADLLLHVVDAADPAMPAQLAVTKQVLREVGADATPSWLLLNKADKLTPEAREALALHYPDGIFLSAHRPEDVAMLRQQLVAHLAGGEEEREITLGWQAQRLVAALHARCQVLSEIHSEVGTTLRVRGGKRVLDELWAEIDGAGYAVHLN